MKYVAGILVDFYAARDIFTRAVPAELAAVTDLRGQNRLAFCCDEEDVILGDPHARMIIGNAPPIYLPYNDAVVDGCEALSAQIPDHKFLGEARTQVHVAAYARAHNFGVLTEHRQVFYATVPECCGLLGVHSWRCAEFFPDLPNIEFV